MNQDEILAAVRGYMARKWVVHPLSQPDDKGSSPGKKPVLSGWQQLTATPEDIGRYVKQGCNIGLVCGKASGVDAFDLDCEIFKDELLEGVGEYKTLISSHRLGRGHILFQHEDDVFSEKHHFIGIEYFGSNEEGAGSNLVLPPSIHSSGEKYQWLDAAAPLEKMQLKLKENWKKLAKKEDELHAYFQKCRHCFTKGSKKYDKTDMRSKGLWERPDDIAIHGMDGRRAVLAIMGELKANGCTDDLLHMVSKRLFGKEYNYNTTTDALKHIEPIHPKCDTLRQYLNVECDGCTFREKNQPKLTNQKEGKEPKKKGKPEYVHVIPQEQIYPIPITIQEVVQEFERNLHIKDQINITIPLAYATSNFAPCDPDVLGIYFTDSFFTEVAQVMD